MIENQNETSKGMESALRQLEQAKARVAEEKRKASAERRKFENKHKYMMGGVVHKYFPECYSFDEDEMNIILSAAIKTDAFTNAVANVKRNAKGGGNVATARTAEE